MKTIKIGILLVLCSYLISCGQINFNQSLRGDRQTNSLVLNSTNSDLAEVATPPTIKQLNQDLEQYLPQVKIISPQPKQTFSQTDIEIKLTVEDLPLFQDEKLKLGNHLNLIVDNEPVREIYSTKQPITIRDLSPGTHSIRVFATRPWGESFKTEGAYAQTTFNVLTETNDNRPNLNLPLLTYNSPTGTYGAEPLLLDFYLNNATLHAIARNDLNLSDWRIRVTINGTSFILQDWQPIYLTGIKPGENWVQLELVDEMGNNIENVFNNTVRVFNFDPQQQDTLAKLVTNDISLAEARSIIEQNYYPAEEAKVIDLEDKTEAEIIAGDAVDNLDEPDLAPEDINQVNEPGSEIPITETNQINQPEIIKNSKQAEAKPETSPLKENETQIGSNLTPLVRKDSQAGLNSEIEITPADVQPEQPTETIVINEAVPNLEEPATVIDISQAESVEITESEIAITIPKTESSQTYTVSNSNPETKLQTSSWWKKILVRLRHKLEALAKLLPNQAELS